MKEFFTTISMPKVLLLTIVTSAVAGWIVRPRHRQPRPARQRACLPEDLSSRSVGDPQPMTADLVDGTAVPSSSIAVKPLQVWHGTLSGNSSALNVSLGQVVSDVKVFLKLWSGFRGTDRPPDVDFQKEVVVVGMIRGSNHADLDVRRCPAGGVWMSIRGDGVNAEGLCYVFARFSRADLQPDRLLAPAKTRG
ncbi:MAG: hypothetical protein ACE5KM_09595 [Planctomycetaceae bacterium]